MSENKNEAALRRYLTHMDSGDYSSAIKIFASDAVYIRPLIGAGASTPVLAELVGREAIAQSWEQRGRRNIVHDVKVLVTDGDDTFAEGVATVDGERTLLFVTHATFDGSGQVRRLVAQSAPLGVLGRSTPAHPSDNLAVEPVGSTRVGDYGPGRKGRLHAQLIALLGMALGELWQLNALAGDCATDGVYEFQLVCSPLNLVGGAGTPANATAIK